MVLIHILTRLYVASAPKQVQRRVPRVLAFDASGTAEFGHGWIAMTRMAGSSLAECWLEFRLEQRKRVIEDLARFTRKLARFRVSGEIGSIATAASSSRVWSSKNAHTTTSLSLPRRNGANNLRPVSSRVAKRHLTTASFLMDAVEGEIAFLREHQKPAVRCFNMNMLRLRQCGMENEIPLDAAFGSTTSHLYKKKLRALGELAQTVVGASPMDGRWEPERFVLAHLDMSPDNVLVDPESGAMLGIVDWEFAGFVPDWLALAAPSWISDEWLPSWTSEDGWTNSGEDGERDPFGLESESYALELDILRRTWASEVVWEDQDTNINASKEKRQAWRACLSEWHQLERACAWAKTMVDLDDDTFDTDATNSDCETTQSETEHTSNCSPSTIESSLGPQTPVDSRSTMDLLSMFERPGLKLDIQPEADEDSEDEDDSDGSSDEGAEVVQDDMDFEDFAAAFAPPPLPHLTAPSVVLTAPSPLTKAPAFSLAGGKTSRQIQSSSPCRSLLGSSSRWSVLWETPKVDIQRDLEFVLERDLDAGW